MSGLRLVKRHKRMWIIDEDGQEVYTPPDFLQVPHRNEFHNLIADMIAIGYILAVMRFESKHHRKR